MRRQIVSTMFNYEENQKANGRITRRNNFMFFVLHFRDPSRVEVAALMILMKNGSNQQGFQSRIQQ